MDILKLIEDIESPEVSVRRIAAKDLAGTDERAVYPLLKALRDNNPGVQDAAMRSLVAIGGEVVAYMVLPLLREDSFLRNTAILILKDIGVASVPLLYPLLNDKDDDVRKFALDLLGDIRDQVDCDKLTPLINDPNPNVRASAIRAMGILRPEAVVDRLVASLQDEEWVTFSALEMLATIKDERAVGPITDLLESDSETLRMAAVETLGAMGSSKASDALFEYVKKSDGMELNEGIKSLVQTGVTPSMSAVYDLLLDLVQKGEWDEQKIAIRGLVDLRDVNAIPFIIDVAGSLDESVPGEDEKIMDIVRMLKEFGETEVYADVLRNSETRYKGRVIAADLAGETMSVNAVPALVEALANDLRDVKRSCALALGRIGTPEAIDALMKAVNDHEGHVRKTAILGLGQPGNEVPFEMLLRHLEEEEYDDILEQTVKSLLIINSRRFYEHLDRFPAKIKEAVARASRDLDILLKLSNDPDLSVGLASIAGLGTIKDNQAIERVLEASRSYDAEVRKTAVMALAGMDVGHDSIIPLLQDKDMWVRLHAVRVLGQRGNDIILEFLAPMLNDPEIPVVLAAVESVSAIGGREAYDLLAPLEEHTDDRVRQAATDAIERM